MEISELQMKISSILKELNRLSDKLRSTKLQSLRSIYKKYNLSDYYHVSLNKYLRESGIVSYEKFKGHNYYRTKFMPDIDYHVNQYCLSFKKTPVKDFPALQSRSSYPFIGDKVYFMNNSSITTGVISGITWAHKDKPVSVPKHCDLVYTVSVDGEFVEFKSTDIYPSVDDLLSAMKLSFLASLK